MATIFSMPEPLLLRIRLSAQTEVTPAPDGRNLAEQDERPLDRGHPNVYYSLE